MTSRRVGKVYLVGAGPGDPELITVRGAELLGLADTVVYDRLIHPALLRRARRGARLFFVGKEGGGVQTSQEEINALLVSQARLGRKVVRLKGGDPFVFGRGGEEALVLAAAKIPYEVVPGVSSGVAVPALVGIPVTHRGVATSVTFATARSATGSPDFAALAGVQTLVLFMAGQQLTETTTGLIAAGRHPRTPAAVIESGSWDEERVVEGTLQDIGSRAERAKVGSPALLVVGEVVGLRKAIAAGMSRPELRGSESRRSVR